MISNQILQNTIEGLKGITRIDFCVMDTDGKSLASTFSEQDNYEEEAVSFVEPRQTVRLYRDISSLRFLTSISWNTSCLPMEAAMMYIW